MGGGSHASIFGQMFNDLILEQMLIAKRFLDETEKEFRRGEYTNGKVNLYNAQETLSQAIRLRERALQSGEES